MQPGGTPDETMTLKIIKIIFVSILTALAFVEPLHAADSAVATQARSQVVREKISMDSGWRFHLGDAPDAGKQFEYPEVKDLAKTRANEIGLEGTLATTLP